MAACCTDGTDPNTCRSQGVGAAHAIHSIAGVIGPVFAGAFVDVNVRVTILGFIGVVAVASVAACALPRESKGKELRDTLDDGDAAGAKAPAGGSMR